MLKEGKRGQVSVFVIIALLIVLGIVGYFAVRGQTSGSSSQGEFSEVFSYYQQCIEQYTHTGLSLAASKGGRIYDGLYEPGSSYAPFGSHLMVSGTPVEYWVSLSGNGAIEENVPTHEEIESDLGEYVLSRLNDCNFDVFRERGIDVSLSPQNVEASIDSDTVSVSVSSALNAANENSSAFEDNFQIEVESEFGSLLGDALELYEKQNTELFLENYTFDVLRLYAPVDGVEIQCSPKVWVAQDVFSDLKEGIDSNLESIVFQQERDYFGVRLNLDNDAQVLYDPEWPSRLEVYGNQGNLLVANPIGNQQGLQTLGFCYVPYHFVYDVFFPVILRVQSETEFFQFPVVVMIDKNVPRQAGSTLSLDSTEEIDICSSATQDLRLIVRGNSGSINNASVSYSCFDQICRVGETNSNGVLVGNIPACLNGYLEVSAEGYATTSELYSSHNTTEIDLRLEREYPVEVRLKVDGLESNALAFVSLQGDSTRQAVIPDSRVVGLKTGFYNVSIYQYGNASIRIPASTSRQCLEVSAGGLAGLFGRTKEECFDIPLPETIIEQALTAGGQGEIYLPEELLEDGELVLTVNSLPKPTGIESLETNYALFETQGVDVEYE